MYILINKSDIMLDHYLSCFRVQWKNSCCENTESGGSGHHNYRVSFTQMRIRKSDYIKFCM